MPPTAIRWYCPALVAILLIGTGLVLLLFSGDIATRSFGDPDDLMRLQEVRDWLAGQSWFDVTQYRISPPGGLHMHWSRLLDVPIAGVILLSRNWIGQADAETLASVIVPMITLGCILLLVASIARQLLSEDRLALLAAALCFIDFGVYSTTHPLRIDHHGWQVVVALVIVRLLLGRRSAGRSAIAGAAAALWMHISLEGIVFTVAVGGWLALRWIVTPKREHGALPAYLAAIAAASLGLFIVAHGGALFDRTFCDAVSPVHIVVFAVIAAGAMLAEIVAPDRWVWRLILLSLLAAAAVAIYRLWAPQCAGGPFALLPPLSYRLWYLKVPEGLPAWDQTTQMAFLGDGFPALGLIGAVIGIREADRRRRPYLIDYAALLAAASVIGLILMRACALSNILAIPGGVILMRAAWRRAMALRAAWLRVPMATAAVLACTPMTPSMAAIALIPPGWNAPPRMPPKLAMRAHICMSLDNLAHLNQLPPALFMTTLGSSQALIAASHHSAVGSGYHRDGPPMEASIRFFITSDANARAIMTGYHARYVFVCPGDGDDWMLGRLAPEGLAASLEAGRPPAWLVPVAVSGLRYAKVYKIAG